MPLIDATNALAKVACLPSTAAENTDHIDTLIKSLWQVSNITNMFSSQNGNLVPRYLCKIDTGRDLIRAFLAIFKKYGDHVKNGWNEFVEFLLISADSGILLMTDSIVSGDPISALHRNSMKKRAASPGVHEASFFSTITSYFGGGPSQPSSPADNQPGSSGDDYRGRAGDFLSSCKLEDIFVETKLFSLNPLVNLLKALIAPIMTCGKKYRTESLILLIDLAVYCALQNRDRLKELWPILFDGFSSISGSAQADLSLSLREHAALAIGKLALKAAERPELQNHLLEYLQLLCQIPPDFFLNIAEPSLAIIIHMLEAPKSGLLQDERIWPHYFTILSLVSKLKHCAAMTLTLLAAVGKVPNFPVEFFSEFLELTREFCAMLGTLEENDLKGSVIESTPVEMGTKIIKVMQNLLEKTKREEEILVVLSQQCLHPIKEIRQQALSALQKSAHLPDTRLDPYVLFLKILFPLIDSLTKPDVITSRHALDEMQLRMASLTFKVLYHRVSEMRFGSEQFNNFWRELLGKLLSFIGRPGNGSEAVREAVGENIKNAISVFQSMELVPGGEDPFLKMTFDIVDPILPEVKQSLCASTANIGSSSGLEERISKMNIEGENKGGPLGNSESIVTSPGGVVHIV
jgi:hypothetical protein